MSRERLLVVGAVGNESKWGVADGLAQIARSLCSFRRFRMSKTLYVEFRGRGFWAFDAVSGIFLKHLIDVAESCIAGRHEPWLAEAIARWRFNAICGDCGLFLDEA